MTYSVIIPAYNAEKTIERCLDSLLPQLPEDGEIILVDDGSVDRTLDICKEYTCRSDQLRVISKANGGVSSARNAGLDAAQGTYILFVDSDDIVTSDYFQQLRKATENEPDFVVFHMDDRSLKNRLETLCAEQTETRRILGKAMRRQLLNCIWAKAFRRSIISENSLRFDERLSIGEDKVFVVWFSLMICSSYFSSAQIYVQCTDNMDSLSRKKRENLADEILLEHEMLFDAAKNADDPSIVSAITFSYIRSAYSVIRELKKFSLSRAERLLRTREICEKYCSGLAELRYGSLKDWLISLPIRLRLVATIDAMLQLKS